MPIESLSERIDHYLYFDHRARRIDFALATACLAGCLALIRTENISTALSLVACTITIRFLLFRQRQYREWISALNDSGSSLVFAKWAHLASPSLSAGVHASSWKVSRGHPGLMSPHPVLSKPPLQATGTNAVSTRVQAFRQLAEQISLFAFEQVMGEDPHYDISEKARIIGSTAYFPDYKAMLRVRGTTVVLTKGGKVIARHRLPIQSNDLANQSNELAKALASKLTERISKPAMR